MRRFGPGSGDHREHRSDRAGDGWSARYRPLHRLAPMRAHATCGCITHATPDLPPAVDARCARCRRDSVDVAFVLRPCSGRPIRVAQRRSARLASSRGHPTRRSPRPEETGFPGAYAVFRDAVLADRPWATAPSAEEVLAQLQKEDATEKAQWFAAFDGDRVVGMGHALLPLQDNVEKTLLSVCVAPPDRRPGHRHGDRAPPLRLCRRAPSHAAPRPVLAAVRRRRRPPLPRLLPLARLRTRAHRDRPAPAAAGRRRPADGLLDDAKPHYRDGYTIETHVDGVPDDLLPSYCAAHNKLSTDAPSGSVEFEEMSLTPELYRSNQEVNRRLGAVQITAVALTRIARWPPTPSCTCPRRAPTAHFRVERWSRLRTADTASERR